MNGFSKALAVEIVVLSIIGVCTALGLTRPVSSPAAVTVNLIGAAAPRVQTTVYSANWCTPCKTYVKAIFFEMPTAGWIVRSDKDIDSASANIIVTKSESEWTTLKIEKLPCTIIRTDGVESDRFYGSVKAEDLAERINKIARAAK